MGEIADMLVDQMIGSDTLDPIEHAHSCPYCGAEAVRQSHRVVYGRTIAGAGDVLVCLNYPTCDSYVGCHRDGRPKGPLANAELRAARKAAHDAFDTLWRRRLDGEGMSRGEAYRWLAERLNLPAEECHMGEMTELSVLREVVRVSEQKLGAPARQIRARNDFKFA